ncbi:IRE protein kinase [Phakopsora pachyrhizi]|uniref:non-specific serine/threonine protein kinase n=1 Tax=Phakopsora pachyrhizi TaxID=170000 RepID=A0AAV0B582_PHAPC|nr:IRE protein kinase [Phakopsora pachyrhizi]CAH7682124.1 IRE protein kinase [Phakopsora pachyrhizi]
MRSTPSPSVMTSGPSSSSSSKSTITPNHHHSIHKLRTHSTGSSSQLSSEPPNHYEANRFQLSPLVLITTLDGRLHALDRNTGKWNWTLRDQNKIYRRSGLKNLRQGVVSSQSEREVYRLTDDGREEDQDEERFVEEELEDEDEVETSTDELYAIEPKDDGDLYLIRPDSSQPQASRLEKLPISVSQLVNLSPFTFPSGHDSKMFIGKKETQLLGIDIRNGTLVSVLSNHASKKLKRSNSTRSDATDQQGTCSAALPQSSKPDDCSSSQSNHAKQESSAEETVSIADRPQDLLYIGRTEYKVSIYSKPNKLLQTLRYSTYAPSSLAPGRQSMWTKTPDELYLEPTHDGNLVCFHAALKVDKTGHSSLERGKIKWQNSFDHPVNSIFDLVHPRSDQYAYTRSHQTSSQESDLPSGVGTEKSLIKSASSQRHPTIFVQPKLIPPTTDSSHTSYASPIYEQFDLLINSPRPEATTSSSSSHQSRLHDKAFLGKFGKSYFVMSQSNYPLIAFAPSAYSTPENEPMVGTHRLFETRNENPFFHYSLSNRLLDPSNPSSNQEAVAHQKNYQIRFALDPPLQPPALPPSTPPPSSVGYSDTNGPNDSKTRHTDQIPVQFQQKAAELSSLIVRTIKNQMISNPDGARHQNHSGNSDEQSLTLNPVVALLFVVVVMSMWASKKVGPQSLHRWNHLLRSTHYGSNRDNESEKADQDVDRIKMIGDSIKVVELSGSPSKAAPVELICDKAFSNEDLSSQVEPTERGKKQASVKLDSKVVDVKEISKPQKAKRMRGKRPGQKAAARAEAAAKTANLKCDEPLMTTVPVSVDPAVEWMKLDPKGPEEIRRINEAPRSNSKTKKKQTSKLEPAKSEKDQNQSKSFELSSSNSSSSLNLSKKASKKLLKEKKANVAQRNVQFDLSEPESQEEDGRISQTGGWNPQKVGSLRVTDETIGYGSHGTVVLKGRFQGRQVAVKRLLKDFVTIAMHEVDLLQESDDHPNVVRYFVKESLENFLYIGLELCNGSLFDLMESKEFEGSEELRRIFNPKRALRQITAGVRHLHKLKIVHRDIKPQNILIILNRSKLGKPESSQRTKLKNREGGRTSREVEQSFGSFRMLISDFGLCKKLEIDESSFAQTTNHATGSFGYRAPEILKGQVNVNEPIIQTNGSSTNTNSSTTTNGGNGSSSTNTSNNKSSKQRLTRSIDIFSLGCIYYYVLSRGDHPFGSRLEREVRILKGEFCLDQLEDYEDEESFESRALIRSMIRSDPRKRPTAEEVLQNPYFWEPNKRLMFLCDCSDRFEIMEREPTTTPKSTMSAKGTNNDRMMSNRIEEALTELEKGYIEEEDGDENKDEGEKEKRVVKEECKRIDWYKKFDRILLENLGKYRRYDGRSVRDLLRVLRNKKHHYQDLSEGLKKTLGELPEGFLKYFLKRYPWLIVHAYKVILNNRLNEEMLFKKNYFEYLKGEEDE